MKISELLLESSLPLDEGVNDPSIFKVVFVIGGPGSGKSWVASKLGLTSVMTSKDRSKTTTTSGSLGYTVMNPDIAFEYLMKVHELDSKMPEHEKERRDVVRQRAKDITASKNSLAMKGRLGIVIDGTGDDYDKIVRLKANFEELGYDSYLVVVNTDLEVARQSNQQRARTVPDDIVVKSWRDVQSNIGKFTQIFDNVSIIDNSDRTPNSPETAKQIQSTYKKLQKFSATPPNKPAAKQWIAAQRSGQNGQTPS